MARSEHVCPVKDSTGPANSATSTGGGNSGFPSVILEDTKITSPENLRGPSVIPQTKHGMKYSHVRAKSVTISKKNVAFSEGEQPYRRVRASSVLEKPPSARYGERRPGGTSHSRFVPIQPIPSTHLYVANDEQEMLGSFAPTSQVRPRLRSLLSTELCKGPQPQPSNSFNIGSGSSWLSNTTFSNPISPFSLPHPHSPVVPSISRTPSPYTDPESLPSVPSSAGPSTPTRSRTSSPIGTTRSLHSVLESLEDASKFHVRTCCATCKKVGSNFPCCPKCGEMWCSRACRLQGNSGKRHECGRSRM